MECRALQAWPGQASRVCELGLSPAGTHELYREKESFSEAPEADPTEGERKVLLPAAQFFPNPSLPNSNHSLPLTQTRNLQPHSRLHFCAVGLRSLCRSMTHLVPRFGIILIPYTHTHLIHIRAQNFRVAPKVWVFYNN